MRGEIENPNRARQLVDFSGLRWGNITPTDIDGLIEYKNRCFVLFELKTEGRQMPFGQELALKRMADALSEVKPTILLLGTHNTPVEQDIDAANVTVSRYYYNREWRDCQPSPLKSLLDLYFKKQESS